MSHARSVLAAHDIGSPARVGASVRNKANTNMFTKSHDDVDSTAILIETVPCQLFLETNCCLFTALATFKGLTMISSCPCNGGFYDKVILKAHNSRRRTRLWLKFEGLLHCFFFLSVSMLSLSISTCYLLPN